MISNAFNSKNSICTSYCVVLIQSNVMRGLILSQSSLKYVYIDEDCSHNHISTCAFTLYLYKNFETNLFKEM